jgi:hypothetical protein
MAMRWLARMTRDGERFALLGVTLLTVSYQSVRAAWANPADSLRNE